jgi:hypothetical protein
MLRSFSYLDEALLDDFLAQVEGGLYEEQSERQERSGKGGVRAGGKVGPVEAGGSKDKSHTEEVARIVRQTPTSRFDRLYEGLVEQEQVQFLDAIDQDIWDQLRRGEIVEIEGVVRSAGLEKIVDLFKSFSELLPIMEATGTVDTEINSEMSSAMGALSSINDLNRSNDATWITVELASSPGFTFGAELRPSNLTRGLDQSEGEATVFGKIRRLLRAGEELMLPSVFSGLEGVLPEDERRKLSDVFEDPRIAALGLGSPRLVYPAAILSVVAIYL